MNLSNIEKFKNQIKNSKKNISYSKLKKNFNVNLLIK